MLKRIGKIITADSTACGMLSGFAGCIRLSCGGVVYHRWLPGRRRLCDLHADGTATHRGCDPDGRVGYCVDRD